MRRALAMIWAALVSVVLGHAQGVHVRAALSVSKFAVDGVLVMDVDAGDRAKLLRAGADANHDGVLSTDERAVLEKKLVTLATKDFKLGLSGYALPLKVTQVKLSLREDKRASDTGLSLALMLEATVKQPISAGNELEVEAVSPDGSHVTVEVSALSGPDGGVEGVGQRELTPKEKWKLRLGTLESR